MSDADRRYLACFRFVSREEGGLADRPLSEDPGGITNHGLSLRLARSLGTMFDLNGDGQVGRNDILLVRPEHTEWAFRELFWRPVHGDTLWAGLDLCTFDMAVHSGVGRATRFMQRALGVTVDGLIGPQTLRAVASAARDMSRRQTIIESFCTARLEWLRDLPNFPTNPGWVSRVRRVRTAALTMARSV